MNQLKQGFEINLRAKLNQKSSATQSEEIVLARNFRYFDADNDGVVSLDEWIRAIEKIGVVVTSKNDLKELFKIYDLNGNGEIDYKEFIKILYTKEEHRYYFVKSQS